jgi:hypothetical protein
VVGVEIRRVGDADNQRRPVFKLSETSYPAAYRGTVAIVGGAIRVTPEVPFANGDIVEFMRGGASAHLLEPRDVNAKLYLDMPIEHVPALYDASALYPFEGIAVRPQPAALTVSGVSAGATVPDAFTSGQWSLTAGDTLLTVGITALPDDGGSAITDLEYRLDGGSWTSLGGTTTGNYNLTGLTNGTEYDVELRAVNAIGNASASDLKSATPAAAAVSFTLSGTGPYFVDPANVPANTTRIEFEAKISLADYPPSSQINLFTQESTGCDLLILSAGGGTSATWRMIVKDGSNAIVINSTGAGNTGVTLPALSTWFTVKFDADFGAGTARILIDGAQVFSTALTGTGVFLSNREISFFATTAGGAPLRSGTQIEYVEAYFTTSGVRSLRKRIEGNAATVNADAWKQGGNAT